jgi:hypothetical protein
MSERFDDIRPYYDSEINDAMLRIVKDPIFSTLSQFVFPNRDVEEVKQLVASIDCIHHFQRHVMYPATLSIVQKTMDDFTYSGLEHVDPAQSYLYVSNHRDIMLDAALLQSVFIKNQLKTTEITFGANLMQHPVVIDIGKSNKMFKVERPGGGLREFYRASKHLSEYIRTTLLEKKESVWIAQRNGRTKDGIDRTDQGIINMFRMSCRGNQVQSIAELQILPIAISYEWEPCDVLKTLELYATQQHGTYVKQKGEDLNSILTGIMQPKGKVHIALCPPITAGDLLPYAAYATNDFNRKVAEIMDQRICSAYVLYANNYIAHDLLSGTDTYAQHYTAAQKEKFEAHMAQIDAHAPQKDVALLRRIFLGIYAHCIDSKLIFKA